MLFGSIALPWLASSLVTISQQRGRIGKVWRAEVPDHWPRDEGPDRWFFFGFWSRGGIVESHTVSALPDVRSDRFVSLTELRAGWPVPSLRSVHLAEVDDRGIVIHPMSSVARTGIPIPGTRPVDASAVQGRTLPVRPLWSGIAINALVWGLLAAGASELIIAKIRHSRAESLASRGLCHECGYELSGLTICPECGHSIIDAAPSHTSSGPKP